MVAPLKTRTALAVALNLQGLELVTALVQPVSRTHRTHCASAASESAIEMAMMVQGLELVAALRVLQTATASATVGAVAAAALAAAAPLQQALASAELASALVMVQGPDAAA